MYISPRLNHISLKFHGALSRNFSISLKSQNVNIVCVPENLKIMAHFYEIKVSYCSVLNLLTNDFSCRWPGWEDYNLKGYIFL